jgi:hypothetical protein
MSLTKLSLAGNNLIIPGRRASLVSDIPAGDGKIANLFLQCTVFPIIVIFLAPALIGQAGGASLKGQPVRNMEMLR